MPSILIPKLAYTYLQSNASVPFFLAAASECRALPNGQGLQTYLQFDSLTPHSLGLAPECYTPVPRLQVGWKVRLDATAYSMCVRKTVRNLHDPQKRKGFAMKNTKSKPVPVAILPHAPIMTQAGGSV